MRRVALRYLLLPCMLRQELTQDLDCSREHMQKRGIRVGSGDRLKILK